MGKKKGKKKNEIGNSIPKKTYFVVLGFFSSDGYAFCKVSEISVDCRDMQGEREALATVLRCRESELELLRGCLGNTNPDQEQRKGLVQILELFLLLTPYFDWFKWFIGLFSFCFA